MEEVVPFAVFRDESNDVVQCAGGFSGAFVDGGI
jgi:hypothetical protein